MISYRTLVFGAIAVVAAAAPAAPAAADALTPVPLARPIGHTAPVVQHHSLVTQFIDTVVEFEHAFFRIIL